MTNFGTSFKVARESKGISLDQIAKQTRISTRFLLAIEHEEFHLLPGGIFNRGFVRTFAEALGLDPSQAVADYERLVSEPEPGDVLAPVEVVRPKGGRHLYLIPIVILAIAVAIFYVATHDSARRSQNRASPSMPAATPPTTATTPTDAAPPADSPPPSLPERSYSPAQTLTLNIEAREKTWIRVMSDGNSVNPGEVLEPGMSRQFTAASSINISIGNAAGLTLKVNDMPLKPLGKSGQVRSVTITPANLKDLIG